MSFIEAMPWSEGEVAMHTIMRTPDRDNPTAPMLTPQAASMLQRAPLLAIGTRDAEQRPWTTVWGGNPSFSRPLGGSLVGIRAEVDRSHDPVVQVLTKGRDDGEVTREEGPGRMVSGLPIDLMTRKRVKVYGRLVATALGKPDEDKDDGKDSGQGDIQLVVNVEQSFGNCPKYLNKKQIQPATPYPKLLHSSPKLSEDGLELLGRADLFFISSSNADKDMDTNHRGGSAGFVRVLSNEDDGAELVYPEYSGNRLYQTLGNLKSSPRAGICVPDFITGDVLYMTGTTEILVGAAANSVLPRSNLAVKFRVTESRYVQQGLPFRGSPGESSPYNPNVRLLATEGNLAASLDKSASNNATLIKKTAITPTISRFRFATTIPIIFSPGQWVATDFSSELNTGYSHMRDDDPRSINDDFVRTFTVSSSPRTANGHAHDEFEITIRKVGPATSFLFQQHERAASELALRGFGGEFRIRQEPDGYTIVPFVAGGVGITPLMGQMDSLDADRIRLIWTLRVDDIGLAADLFRAHPGLGSSALICLTGNGIATLSADQETALHAVRDAGARCEMRRLKKADLDAVDADVWYICTGTSLRKTLLEWLRGKEVVFEDFDY
ncbi:hypothetical protein K490DRAFT_32975 [Saccharata proteae CBS 121410]|uniref:FAD-binding FR-type domain-containing protein n=1 Tax=Saccharata proteae CBS 121410 TaxID=1314787 RepID=A0A9P4I298_9PEZI|nr:hypothetical protein K490DRAFT_32975 [Saccharata proteae CBS 121410]